MGIHPVTPMCRKSYDEMMGVSYKAVSREEAQSHWTEQYYTFQWACFHQYFTGGCDVGEECDEDKRSTVRYVLSGRLPAPVKRIIGAPEFAEFKVDRDAKVQGTLIPPLWIENVKMKLNKIKEKKPKRSHSP